MYVSQWVDEKTDLNRAPDGFNGFPNIRNMAEIGRRESNARLER
jgi:hypothetical protein